jgi:amino acid exporter
MELLSPYLPGILLAYGVFLLSIMSPGPNILAVMGTSMSVNRTSGLALALGVGTGSCCWAVLAMLGLTSVLASYANALVVIKVLGGLYLLYLAHKSFRAAAAVHDIEAHALAGGKRSPSGYFFRGLAIQMTNPKAALAWVAIMSIGLQAEAPLWVGLIIVGGVTGMSIIIHCLYALLFSTPVMVRVYGKARRWIQGALGAFFTFAGLRLLTSRL